jgi:hypothetical protein
MTYRVRIPTIIGCWKQLVTSDIPVFVKNRDLRRVVYFSNEKGAGSKPGALLADVEIY